MPAMIMSDHGGSLHSVSEILHNSGTDIYKDDSFESESLDTSFTSSGDFSDMKDIKIQSSSEKRLSSTCIEDKNTQINVLKLRSPILTKKTYSQKVVEKAVSTTCISEEDLCSSANNLSTQSAGEPIIYVDPAELNIWEMWLLKKLEMEREKKTLEKQKEKMKREEEERKKEELREKRKKTEEKRQQWLEEKLIKMRLETENERKLKELKEKAKAEEKERIERAAEREFELWKKKYQEKRRAEKNKKKEELKRAERAKEEKKKANEECYQKWLEKKKHQIIVVSPKGYGNGPKPAYINPKPWVPPVNDQQPSRTTTTRPRSATSSRSKLTHQPRRLVSAESFRPVKRRELGAKPWGSGLLKPQTVPLSSSGYRKLYPSSSTSSVVKRTSTPQPGVYAWKR